ncbi:hypothetical protein GUJ93_ZPchr0013g35949 [Zizania palustris]|uniref:Uncharacterized protein n=1 Tax=Zizania palustris TaxID=103762 RepID=A0A8J5WSF7_ZIZPA|nr:hypothetical protein GUJ93_ZPchr0013g35949 [Zizania palustris]
MRLNTRSGDQAKGARNLRSEINDQQTRRWHWTTQTRSMTMKKNDPTKHLDPKQQDLMAQKQKRAHDTCTSGNNKKMLACPKRRNLMHAAHRDLKPRLGRAHRSGRGSKSPTDCGPPVTWPAAHAPMHGQGPSGIYWEGSRRPFHMPSDGAAGPREGAGGLGVWHRRWRRRQWIAAPGRNEIHSGGERQRKDKRR